jgi:hypothetical protein
VRAELQDGYSLVNKNDLTGARDLFIASLKSLLFVVVGSDDEATEVSERS